MSNAGAPEQKEMSFIDHLEELRWHIIRALISIFVFAVIVFIGKDWIIDPLIFGPKKDNFLTYQAFCKLSELLQFGDTLCLKPKPFEVENHGMTSQFMVHLKVSAVLGFIMAFPYVFWEIWRFIKPGLYDSEVQYTRGIVFFVSFFFLVGILFGYFILLPFSINFFAGYQISSLVSNEIRLESYISFITNIVLATGLMFQLPIIVFILSKLGLLTPDIMRNYRRHAGVIILLVSALITPADVMSQVLVSIPVYILYELSIAISARVVKKRALEEELER